MTAGAVVTLLAVAFAATFHITLGFRAFTTEDARRIRVAEAPVPVSSLSVVDSAGASRQLWNGDPQVRAWLVTFIYTDCPKVCVAAGSEFQQLQASISDDVRLASLSFDRARDSSQALAAYAKRFRADPERWLVAVPDSDTALTSLLRETGVIVIGDGMGGYAHNAAIHVITSSGRLVALFDLEQYREALAYARAL